MTARSGREIERIRRAYARRADRRPLYDPRRGDVVALLAARSREWGSRLRELEHDLGATVEVGAGTGVVLRWALEAGADSAIGIDVQQERLEVSRAANPRAIALVADAARLPLRDRAADSVACSTLFSSVLDSEVSAAAAREIERILRPGGLILWFDLSRDNPRNPDVRGLSRSDVAALFPRFDQRLRKVVLLPPIARRLERWPRVASLLEALPPLRTHLAGVLVDRR